MEIKNLRPTYENKESEQKIISETLNRICRKFAVERNKSKRCG